MSSSQSKSAFLDLTKSRTFLLLPIMKNKRQSDDKNDTENSRNEASQTVKSHYFLIPASGLLVVGRGCGVGRGLGVTLGLGVADGVGVGVIAAVGLGVGVGVAVEMSSQVSLKDPLLS